MNETKKCSRCGKTKDLKCFYKWNLSKDGHQSQCKDCRYTASTKCREKSRESYVRYYKNHKEKEAKRHLKYYEKNKERILERNRQYKKKNKEKRNQYRTDRRMVDINYKLKNILRCRLYKAVRDDQKAGSAVKDLGCTVEELKKHLESQFTNGMTWNNQGKWHIDHIKPLSKFNLTNRKEFLVACNYKNLQPLWAIDNIKKSNKIY